VLLQEKSSKRYDSYEEKYKNGQSLVSPSPKGGEAGHIKHRHGSKVNTADINHEQEPHSGDRPL